jgi:hypothetical protein
MRSRLEASWAAAFDAHELPWEYEPRAFADQTGQYLPDFHLSTRDLWIEVKPAYLAEEILTADNFDHPLLRRMEIIWSSVPTDRLALVCGQPEEAEAFRTDSDHQWWWAKSAAYLWDKT